MAIVATDWAWPTTVTGTGWSATTGTLADALLSDDTNYASSTSPLSSTPLQMSDWITAPATPLAIPPGGTPVGLEIKFRAWSASASVVIPTRVAFRFGYTPGTMLYDEKTQDVIDITNQPGTEFTLGGASDLWGGGWTDVQAEAAALHFYGAGFAGFPDASRYLDYCLMRLHYSEGTVIGPGGILAADLTRYIPGLSARGSTFSVKGR